MYIVIDNEPEKMKLTSITLKFYNFDLDTVILFGILFIIPTLRPPPKKNKQKKNTKARAVMLRFSVVFIQTIFFLKNLSKQVAQSKILWVISQYAI